MAGNINMSASLRRAEQLRRWEESVTNTQSVVPKPPKSVRFDPDVLFLSSCADNNKNEVDSLLERGFDINTSNSDGLTALHQACIEDKLDMVEFLVSRGADLNRGDNEGWTPLHATASCGFLSIARFLIENGADVVAVNAEGKLPIDIAEREEMVELLQKVIDERGIDCDQARNSEEQILNMHVNNWAMSEYPQLRDPKTGATPLHVAAAKGYLNAMRLLLDNCDVDPNATDSEGWTPLHAAALWAQKDAIEMLLKHGADPNLRNMNGKKCIDVVDASLASWLPLAIESAKENTAGAAVNNKRKLPPPHHDVKRADLNVVQPEPVVKEEPHKPAETQEETAARPDKAQSWRQPACFKLKAEPSISEDETTVAPDTSMLSRTHSFESDIAFYERYRAVTARIKASSGSLASAQLNMAGQKRGPRANATPTGTVETASAERLDTNENTTAENENATNAVQSTTVRRSESIETNSTNSTPSSTTPTKLSPGNIFKNFFKAFVPPARDEESETQRKAHAKRVRETRRSTQGVTLDEIKTAEQFIKNKSSSNGVIEPQPSTSGRGDEATTGNGAARGAGAAAVAVTVALACASATATATIAANGERRPSWRLRLDPTNKFELEDVSHVLPATTVPPPPAPETTTTLPLRAPAPVRWFEAAPSRDNEDGAEIKSPANSISTQAAMNKIQRRRRPKRRSTGVARADVSEILNNTGAEDSEENVPSEGEIGDDSDDKDYRALYEAQKEETRRFRILLRASEDRLREAEATVEILTTKLNQTSLSEIDKREKRAMERKLSEMEEELKLLQKLKGENERLKAENRALTRVVSKLTNSAAK